MTNKKLWLFFVVVVAALGLALSGCSSSDDDGGNDGGIVDPPLETTATCEGCHTDEAMLKATVEPEEEAPESEGEG